MASNPSLKPEIGPDGLARESPIIAYTEKVIAQEQLQLHKYIEENRSMLLGVERELANLSMEMKLTAGPKKAALEHLRKKIEISSEKIHQAKVKEEQARKAWEAAVQALKDEESMKQKLCEDLNQLVQESSSSQFTRLEELKRRLEALNPNRASSASPHSGQPVRPTQNNTATGASSVPPPTAPDSNENTGNAANQEQNSQAPNGPTQQQPASGGAKKKAQVQGKGRGVLGAVPKRSPGWTGAGFDVDGRN
ncbi:unnamed protein product [Linum trigynum]|uniref:RAB6-interacting golgin n=1 Tax=Linum trigynum TaxID=586398 RepID=A0AAV2G656_9ROSI